MGGIVRIKLPVYGFYSKDWQYFVDQLKNDTIKTTIVFNLINNDAECNYALTNNTSRDVSQIIYNPVNRTMIFYYEYYGRGEDLDCGENVDKELARINASTTIPYKFQLTIPYESRLMEYFEMIRNNCIFRTGEDLPDDDCCCDADTLEDINTAFYKNVKSCSECQVVRNWGTEMLEPLQPFQSRK